MAFFGRSLLSRTAIGAGLGLGYGAATDWGDWGGMAGATLGGAAMGAGLGPISRGVSRIARPFGPALGAALARGQGWAAGTAFRLGEMGAARGGWAGGTLSNLAGGLGALAGPKAGPLVNKWGGRALAAMGMASGAYIGRSVLGSNDGYR